MKNTIAPFQGQIGHFLPDMRERAVDLARRGFRVFKLEVNGKRPAVEKFYDVASSDPERVRAAWSCPVSGESLDNNIGVLTGDGLLVLDVDVRKDKPGKPKSRPTKKSEQPYGFDALKKLKREGVITNLKTLKVRTPSGGAHYYFKVPPELRLSGSASRIAPGIDIRAHHNYVAGPGSEINGCKYEWEAGGE